MKTAKWICICLLFFLARNAAAQPARKNYQFSTGADICLMPGQSMPIGLIYNDVRHTVKTGKSFTAGSGSGWDNGSITVTLARQ